MRRRRYLGLLSAAAAGTLAGCGGKKTLSLGESASHKGVVATVRDFKIADSMTTYSNQKVPEGDVGLAVRSTVENTADVPRPFPNPARNTIFARVNGDRISNLFPTSPVNVGGQNLTTYSYLQAERLVNNTDSLNPDYATTIEPGRTLDAWTVFVAPADVTPAETTVIMKIGSTDDKKTVQWKLA